MSEPKGSVRVECRVTGQWAISLLTKGWSEQEKARLVRGDDEATDALKEAALRATIAEPDDVEDHTYEIRLLPHPANQEGKVSRDE